MFYLVQIIKSNYIYSVRKSPKSRGSNRSEDKTAMIFVFITLVFIISHIPRLILDCHELFNSHIANACQEASMKDIAPAWTFIMIYISHFCLALNATLNMVVYGFLSRDFQKELKSLRWKMCCWNNVVTV